GQVVSQPAQVAGLGHLIRSLRERAVDLEETVERLEERLGAGDADLRLIGVKLHASQHHATDRAAGEHEDPENASRKPHANNAAPRQYHRPEKAAMLRVPGKLLIPRIALI